LGYETRLQQQQTELENASEKLDSAGKECWRLSSENGNFISKVIYHFHDGNVFACAFQNCLPPTFYWYHSVPHYIDLLFN
jgi:hypothetical protein